MIDDLKKNVLLRRPKPMVLDMGLGSREQGFRRQKPALKLVRTNPTS